MPEPVQLLNNRIKAFRRISIMKDMRLLQNPVCSSSSDSTPRMWCALFGPFFYIWSVGPMATMPGN